MRRGPKGKPEGVKKLAGTARKDRKVIELFQASPGAPVKSPVKPSRLTQEASQVWDDKVARFAARGLAVEGCEDTLAEYCELQAEILRRRANNIKLEADLNRAATVEEKKRAAEMMQLLYRPISVAMWATLKGYAPEFYETPASGKVALQAGPNKENPFKAGMNRGQGR